MVAESAAVAYAGVFVGSVLVAAGVYFANSGDMRVLVLLCIGRYKRVMRR